jgi:hypothetical protein
VDQRNRLVMGESHSELKQDIWVVPSAATSKPAIHGRVKTGQWEAVRD